MKYDQQPTLRTRSGRRLLVITYPTAACCRDRVDDAVIYFSIPLKT
jgi:hypothetical protein